MGLIREELDQGLLLIWGAEDTLPAQSGKSLPLSPPATSPFPLCLLLDPGPCMQCYFSPLGGVAGGVSPTWPLLITVGPAQVPSCIQHCSLRLALARRQDRRHGRTQSQEGQAGPGAACWLSMPQTGKPRVSADPLPGGTEAPFSDPREPHLSGHSTHLLPHPETDGSVAQGTSFGIIRCLFAV